MSQTSYAEQAVGFAGALADLTRGYVKDSGMNGEASAGIAFGKFVVMAAGELTDTAIVAGNSRGTPASFKLPAASTDDFKGGGFVIHSHDYDKRLDLDTNGAIKPAKQLAVLKKGRIWVNAGTAMAVTDNVFVQYTAGIASVGDVANASDGGKNVQLFGARVVTPIAAGGLVQIDVDISAHVGSSAAH